MNRYIKIKSIFKQSRSYKKNGSRSGIVTEGNVLQNLAKQMKNKTNMFMATYWSFYDPQCKIVCKHNL